MATSQAQDPLQSFRFHVDVVSVGGSYRLSTGPTGGKAPQAGFNQVSTPEMTVESVEYREGQFVYTRKYPGIPGTSDVSMSRGVARGDSSFWSWLKDTIEGGEYRADLQIKHYDRVALSGSNPGFLDVDKWARMYIVNEAFPIRHKVAGDLDATASEISIQEIDCAYNYFDVIETGI